MRLSELARSPVTSMAGVLRKLLKVPSLAGLPLSSHSSGSAMATVPVPLYLLFPLWLDRFEPEPWWLLTLAFVWGAAIATFFSIQTSLARKTVPKPPEPRLERI